MTDEKAREWRGVKEIFYDSTEQLNARMIFNPQFGLGHVIEFSAYEKLQRENERYRAALTSIAAFHLSEAQIMAAGGVGYLTDAQIAREALG